MYELAFRRSPHLHCAQMLKIRLSRTGKKNAPAYRIVVMPEKHPRDGRALEVLGYFNPSVKPPTFSLDKERLKYWLSQGAQMTEAVKKLAEGKYEFKPYRPKPPETPEEEKEASSQKPKASSEGKTEEGKQKPEQKKEEKTTD